MFTVGLTSIGIGLALSALKFIYLRGFQKGREAEYLVAKALVPKGKYFEE